MVLVVMFPGYKLLQLFHLGLPQNHAFPIGAHTIRDLQEQIEAVAEEAHTVDRSPRR